MCEEDKYRILELLDLLIDSIDIIQQRTAHIKSGDDFLLSPDNMFVLDRDRCRPHLYYDKG